MNDTTPKPDEPEKPTSPPLPEPDGPALPDPPEINPFDDVFPAFVVPPLNLPDPGSGE